MLRFILIQTKNEDVLDFKVRPQRLFQRCVYSFPMCKFKSTMYVYVYVIGQYNKYSKNINLCLIDLTNLSSISFQDSTLNIRRIV